MKYLILFLFITSAHAITNRQIKFGAKKCGYGGANKLVFYAAATPEERACIHSKIGESIAYDAQIIVDRNEREQDRANLNCADYTDPKFIRLCKAIKAR